MKISRELCKYKDIDTSYIKDQINDNQWLVRHFMICNEKWYFGWNQN